MDCIISLYLYFWSTDASCQPFNGKSPSIVSATVKIVATVINSLLQQQL